MALKLRELLGSANLGDASELPWLERIDELSARNRRRRDARTEAALVRARHEAFTELAPAVPDGAPEQLASVAAELEIAEGLPVLRAEALDPLEVRAGLLSHGAVIVRGLVPSATAESLREGVDRAFAGRDAHLAGRPGKRADGWFEPFDPDPAYGLSENAWNRLNAGSGSIWAADSPRMLFELLEAFAAAGVPELVTNYLGERPILSMKKSVLRRVTPDTGGGWHQDGAFLGSGLRTLNVWLALNRCGDEAPGMALVPRRLGELVPTGTEGAHFDWSVSERLVEEIMGGEPLATPIFDAGDALLFDHLCLHRTDADPAMPNSRYATETWCFAGSTYPAEQIPLVL